jgi:hypothetical protein
LGTEVKIPLINRNNAAFNSCDNEIESIKFNVWKNLNIESLSLFLKAKYIIIESDIFCGLANEKLNFGTSFDSHGTCRTSLMVAKCVINLLPNRRMISFDQYYTKYFELRTNIKLKISVTARIYTLQWIIHPFRIVYTEQQDERGERASIHSRRKWAHAPSELCGC